MAQDTRYQHLLKKNNPTRDRRRFKQKLNRGKRIRLCPELDAVKDEYKAHGAASAYRLGIKLGFDSEALRLELQRWKWNKIDYLYRRAARIEAERIDSEMNK